MVPNMLAIIMMARSKERVNIIGPMGHIMMENGMIIKLMVSGHINGLTVGVTLELGKKITCMALVLTNGRMVESILVNIKMIKNMVKELIIGLMAGVMKVVGRMAISMEKPNTT